MIWKLKAEILVLGTFSRTSKNHSPYRHSGGSVERLSMKRSSWTLSRGEFGMCVERDVEILRCFRNSLQWHTRRRMTSDSLAVKNLRRCISLDSAIFIAVCRVIIPMKLKQMRATYTRQQSRLSRSLWIKARDSERSSPGLLTSDPGSNLLEICSPEVFGVPLTGRWTSGEFSKMLTSFCNEMVRFLFNSPTIAVCLAKDLNK